MIYLDWFIKIFASGMRHQRKFSSFLYLLAHCAPGIPCIYRGLKNCCTIYNDSVRE